MSRPAYAALAVVAVILGALLFGPSLYPDQAPPPPPRSATAPTAANAAIPGPAPTAGDHAEGAARATPAPTTQGLRGRIVDAHQAPIAGATVAAFARPRLDPVSAAARARRGERTPPIAQGTTAADGAFALPLPLPTDAPRLELHILADGHGDRTHHAVPPAPGEWADLGDLAVADGLAVTGVVRDRDTELGLPGATVVVMLPAHDGLTVPGRERGRTTLTTADGSYRLDGLRAGLFAIAATAPGHARVELAQQHALADEPNEIDFALPPGRQLAGVVVDERGAGIAAAHVTTAVTADGGEQRRAATCAADGAFAIDDLAIGPTTVRAAATGFDDTVLEPAAVGDGPVRLVLRAQGRIHLRALGADGLPRSRFTATARGAGAAPGRALARVGPIVATPELLRDGALTIAGLAAGEWIVEVEAEGHAKTLSEPASVQNGRATAVEVQLRVGGGLRGRVLDSAGRPLPRASVHAEPPTTVEGELGAAFGALQASPLSRKATLTAVDGSFAFANLAAGTYRVRVQHPRWAPRRVEDIAVADGATLDLGDVFLVAGARISGTALVDGRADTTVVVQLLGIGAGAPPGLALETEVAADGTFTFTAQLAGGRYALLAGRRLREDPVRENADRQQSRVEIELGDGEECQVPLAIRAQ